LLVHVGAVLATLLSLPEPDLSAPDLKVIIPVELVDIAAETNIRAATDGLIPEDDPSSEDANDTITTAADAAIAPPQQAQPEDVVAPPAEPDATDPEPKPEAPPKPQPPTPTRPDPAQTPPRQRPPATPSLEDVLGNMGPFVDPTATRSTPPRTEPNRPPRETSGPPQSGAGDQTAMTARVQDLIRARLEQCWNPPVDQPDPARLVVTVRFVLNRDGSIARGAEEILTPARLPSGDRAMLIAAERALNAVRDCSPYRDLTVLPYEGWRTITFQFNPASMLR
jgi:outer membrane biosynthesis protein TonB